jgi:hypothetical protein
MRVGPINPDDPEYDQLYPKVRWRGGLYRIHKPLANDEVRLITMDGESIRDVPRSEVAQRTRKR